MDNEKLKQLFDLLFDYKENVVYEDIRKLSNTYIQGMEKDEHIPRSTFSILSPEYKELDCANYLAKMIADRIEMQDQKEV